MPVKSGATLRAETNAKVSQISQGSQKGQTTQVNNTQFQPKQTSQNSSSYNGKQTVRGGDELMVMSNARTAQLQKASKDGKFNPSNAYNAGAANFYNAASEAEYNRVNNQRIQASYTTQLYDYVNSGNTSFTRTRDYLNQAKRYADLTDDEEQKKNWGILQDAIKGQYLIDYSTEHNNYYEQRQKIEADIEAQKKIRQDASDAIVLGLYYEGNPQKVYEDANTKIKDNTVLLDDVNLRLGEMEAEADALLRTPEISAAADRLSRTGNPTAMWKVYHDEMGAKDENEAALMRQADQQLTDEFNNAIYQKSKLYTTADIWANTLAGWGGSLAAGYANLESLVARIAGTAKVVRSFEDEQAMLQGKEVANAETPDWAIAAKEHGEKVNQWAQNVNKESQALLNSARESAGKYGKIGVDLATGLLDVGFDTVTGLGLASMGARIIGKSALEAQEMGADLGGQLLYGVANSAVEIISEKLSGGLGLAYGKGFGTDVIEEAVGRLAQTQAGANWLRFITGSLGEGGEEVFSDLMTPFLNWIVDEEARNQHLYEVDPAELLYDFMLGSAIGMFGQATERASGSYAEKNEAAGIPKYGTKNPLSPTSGDTEGIESRVGKVEGKGENRTQKIADQISGGFQQSGYVPTETKDEAYDTATSGQENRKTNEPPPIEEGEEYQIVKGGDAAEFGTPPESAVQGQQGQGSSEGTDIAPEGAESVKPNEKLLTRDESRKALENHEADNKRLANVVPIADAAVSAEKPVHKINGNLFAKTGEEGEPPLSKKVWNWLQQFFVKGEGPNIYSNKLKADVIVNERGLKNDVSHHLGETKAATFEAIPYVIKNGMTVSKTTDDNGKVRSIIVAGKAYLNDKNGKNGKPVNVYCLLKADDAGQNRFYLHEVSDGKGNLYYQLNNAEKDASTALQDSTPQMQGSAEETSSAQSVPQNTDVGKPKGKGSTSTAKMNDIIRKHDHPYGYNPDNAYPKTQQQLWAEKSQSPAQQESGPKETAEIDKIIGKARAKASEMAKALHRSPMGDAYFANELVNMLINEEITPYQAYVAAARGHSQEWVETQVVGRYELATQKDFDRSGLGGFDESTDSIFKIYSNDGTIEGQEGSVENERDNSKANKGIGTGQIFVQRDSGNGGEQSGAQRPVREMVGGVGAQEGNARQTHRTLTEQGKKELKKACEIVGIEDSDILPDDAKPDALYVFEDISDGPISIGLGSDEDTLGLTSSDNSEDSYNILLVLNKNTNGKLGYDAAHEAGHRRIWAKKGRNIQWYSKALNAGLEKLFPSDPLEQHELRKKIYGSFAASWAEDYCNDLGRPLTESELKTLENKSLEDAKDYIISLLDSHDPKGIKSALFDWWMNHEISLELLAGNPLHFSVAGVDSATFEILQENGQSQLVKEGIFTPEEITKINEAVYALNSQSRAMYSQYFGNKRNKAGRTPGTIKESQNKAESEMSTRGEQAQTDTNAEDVTLKYGTGDGTFVSRSNADRSRTADLLTDTQEKKDKQVKRLLDREYSWNDDDVVIAEKLMHDMIRSIRNYQLHLGSKMKPDAFKAMTEMYNALVLKHTSEKSRMGQGLQAEYQFSVSDKIMMRAAKTFLGFTPDGRFAGKAPQAKYAKIYAGMESAAKQIDNAVEANDTKALAQICKDLSDIRNVKKMFGPLSNFVSGVENKVLEKIANSDHAVEALSTLAYGNLNAICDDVQPYKALNAVKTIRVMNMLSNMSTILNNIGNNIASGITSTNALAQATSRIAAKPFENMTGQKVLAREGKGWLANKEIRTAEADALNLATLVQLYGINNERGKLELGSDKGLFNPNANAFEQTMSLYKFFIGMGVEATDQIKAAGLQKSMDIGIDEALSRGEITASQAETMRAEARHEVDRLLYKDNNTVTNFVQGARNFLNKITPGGDGKHGWGNADTGYVGLGDITMAFAKVPANVVKARLLATPEGALLQVAQYIKSVEKAKRMHSQVVARSIMEDSSLSESQKWAKCRQECSGSVYNKLEKIHRNFAQAMSYDECCMRAGINDATEMSQFEMAQASRNIGRAATTIGMMVLGSILRGLGALKDFDQEPDDEIRKMYAQKGYSGLMLNWNAISRPNHEWRDGDLVMGGDWLEVIAMPLTIGACATEAAMSQEDWSRRGGAYMKEMATGGLSKSFEAVGDIPGMADAINFYNAMNSQFIDNNAKGSKLANTMIEYAASSLPSFFIPNAFSQTAAGLDNTVRDVYTTDNIWEQAWNIMKNKGGIKLRQTIPASVDMWGNERTYGDTRFMGFVNKAIVPGSGFRTYKESKYEKEILRLNKEGLNATPKISVNGSFEVGDETYTLTAEEKREFKRNRNTAQAVAYETFMDSPEYKELSDTQRVAVLRNLKMTAERDAKQELLKDRGLDTEVTRAKWETELGLEDQIKYLSAQQQVSALWDKEDKTVTDYSAMDSWLKNDYSRLAEGIQSLLDNSYGKLDDMYDASKHGIDSQMWQKAYDVYSEYTSEEGKDRVEGSYKDWEAGEMWTRIQKATGANEKQTRYFEDSMKLWRNMPVDPENYHDLVDTFDWSRESATALAKTISELTPSGDNKTVSYKQRLTAIARQSGVSDKQKWDAFDAYCPSSYTNIIKQMHKYRDLGWTYEAALKDYDKWMD